MGVEFFKRVFGGSLLGLVLLSAGCTHVIVPSESDYSSEQIPDFNCQTWVEFKNGQDDTTTTTFSKVGSHSYLANLNEWTDVAIEVAVRELEERGMRSSDKTGNVLSLKVVKAGTSMGGWGYKGRIVLEATNGDGLTRTYRGSASSMSIIKASSAAISEGVTRMLSDPDMMEYLSR